MNTRGRFITLDGTEGAGKTTQLEMICNWCEQENISTVFTREPGGTPFSEDIRSILLSSKSKMSAMSELLLILAARREHIQQVIHPALAEGNWVISDRFSDATYAYQHYGRGIPLETLQQLEKLTETDIEPDLRLILGVSAQTAAERLQKRGKILDRFERENAQFFARVATGYRARAQAGGVWIDCEHAPEVIFNQIREHLEALR